MNFYSMRQEVKHNAYPFFIVGSQWLLLFISFSIAVLATGVHYLAASTAYAARRLSGKEDSLQSYATLSSYQLLCVLLNFKVANSQQGNTPLHETNEDAVTDAEFSEVRHPVSGTGEYVLDSELAEKRD